MTTSALVRVGGAMAEGTKLARRIQQLLSQRDAAFARIEADFRERLRAALDESAAETAAAEAMTAADAPVQEGEAPQQAH